MHISNESLVIVLLVGVIAGWLAGRIMRGAGFGLIGDVIVGIIGALVASLLFPSVGVHVGTGLGAEIITSTLGAIIFLALVRLTTRSAYF
jgi:uncharacterized membrane protein YeaQ/YmgE (transglycosylase-associated protein family)